MAEIPNKNSEQTIELYKLQSGINFKEWGYSFHLNGAEEKHKYSPFFPHDLIELSKKLVGSENWVNNNIPEQLTSTATTNYSINTNYISTHNNTNIYEKLIEKLSPLFIKHGFEYWGYTPFIDKILKVYKAHQGVFGTKPMTHYSFDTDGTDDDETEETGSENDTLTFAQFFHKIHDLRFMFIDIKECALSSPLIFLLSLIHDEKNKHYFLDDLAKFSTVKFVYIMEWLFERVFLKEKITRTSGHLIFDYIDNNGIKKIYNKETKDLFGYYSNIVSHLPKSLEKFPSDLNMSCNVPTLMEYPKTKFQWFLTDAVCEKDIEGHLNSKSTSYALFSDVKESTKSLLPYIQASEKAHDLYKEHMERNNPHNWTVRSNHPADGYEIHGMLQFIKDGKEIYDRYKDRPVDVNGKMLKMTEVKGSFLKQMKNALFNHNIEQKMSLENKLAMLKTEKGEEPMAKPDDIELPGDLEEHRIKNKSDMIILGKALKHCIGSKTESKHLFFRFETICAEVDLERKEIVCCRDKKNGKNEDTAAFEEIIYEKFAEIGINLKGQDGSGRPLRVRQEQIEDIRRIHGNDIVDDEGVCHFENYNGEQPIENFEFYGDDGIQNAANIEFRNVVINGNQDIPQEPQIQYNDCNVDTSNIVSYTSEINMRTETLHLEIQENDNITDSLESVKTYPSYEGTSTGSF